VRPDPDDRRRVERLEQARRARPLGQGRRLCPCLEIKKTGLAIRRGTSLQPSCWLRKSGVPSWVATRRRPDCRRISLTLAPRTNCNLLIFNGFWSGQLDSNQRPAVPKTAALPGCAIPRLFRKRCRYTLSALPARRPAPVSPAVEKRMRYPVSRLDAVFFRSSRDHLQHAFRQAA
jgi:hypothetical protein